jgi:hypothetical protein
MSGGPLLPSSVYLGGASGNLSPTFYIPTTNTNTAGAIEGIGLIGSLGANAPAVLQFNMPESIPTGTLKLRMLAMSTSVVGTQVVKLTVSDASTSAAANIGATTLTAEAQSTVTFTAADILIETKLTLTATAPTANQITTVLVTFNNTGTTLVAASVWQFSLVWE